MSIRLVSLVASVAFAWGYGLSHGVLFGDQQKVCKG